MEKLENDINNFIEHRLKQNDSMIKKHSEYSIVLKKYLELSKEIEKTFMNNIALWEEYQQAKSELEVLDLRYAYKTGFTDYGKIFSYKVEN